MGVLCIEGRRASVIVGILLRLVVTTRTGETSDRGTRAMVARNTRMRTAELSVQGQYKNEMCNCKRSKGNLWTDASGLLRTQRL